MAAKVDTVSEIIASSEIVAQASAGPLLPLLLESVDYVVIPLFSKAEFICFKSSRASSNDWSRLLDSAR